MHLLAKEVSHNQEIAVYDATHLYGEKGKFRFLQFSDNAVQGVIDLNDPKRIVLEYPRAIIQLMECNNSSFQHAFIIGHGVGTISGHYPDKRIQVAEIDGKVVELSRTYFGYRRENVELGDGRLLLSREEADTFDYIILDAFTAKGTPVHLTSLQFFEMAKDKLGARGAIIMNLMGKTRNDRLINAIHSTLRETFAYTGAFSLPGESAADIRNIIVMGSNQPIEFQERGMAGFVEIELGQGHIIMDANE